MNRWTGTGHLTKDPKLLETDNGTAICILRVAVERGQAGPGRLLRRQVLRRPGVRLRRVSEGGP